MASGGRKLKPAAEKTATGNPGRRPIPPEPEFTPGHSLAPPKRWPADGYEREEWGRIVPDLMRCGIAKAVHQGALEKICELYAAGVLQYEAKDYAGSRLSAAEYRKALNEFGLTAASAGKIGRFVGGGNAGADGDKDPTDEFFSGPRAVDD